MKLTKRNHTSKKFRYDLGQGRDWIECVSGLYPTKTGFRRLDDTDSKQASSALQI
jgi:hypothetical protein